MKLCSVGMNERLDCECTLGASILHEEGNGDKT